MARKVWTAFLTCMLCLCFARPAWASSNAVLSFSNEGITAAGDTAGYSISGTTLTITKAGVYELTGSCAEGSVVVAGSLDGVVLVLNDLSLASSSTAPIVVKKASSVTIHLEGSSVLSDNEDASTEETNADFEGAAIKAKTGSTVTFCGDGTLTVNGSAKNGIKGGTSSSLVFLQGTYNVSSANNGIAADGSVTISGGSYVITGDNDGDVAGDGIQAEHTLAISGGTFDIKTLDGYGSTSFDKDTMSCKGLKASGDREDIENTINVTGGSFSLDTADDAVHSDEYVTITGGTFDIKTGDDGMHADTSLILGSEGSSVDRDPYVNITNSYEALEGGTVYVFSGSYNVRASDDGINAAGGSSDGTDQKPGGDNFNPGGGGPGGGFPGGGMWPFAEGEESLEGMAASDYCIYVYGGNVYVNADGDGLDSNGNIVLNGGNVEVWGQSQGDNEPLDCDGSVSIKGATVLAAGNRGMGYIQPASGSQGYKAVSGSIASGRTLTVATASNGSTVYQTKAPKSASYLFFSSPDTTSSYAISAGTGSVSCQHGNAWTHSWNEGVTSDGVVTYTCTVCEATSTQTAPTATDTHCEGHEAVDQGETEADEGYSVTFDVSEGVSVNVYHTQDYTSASETGVTSTVSRNSTTGEADSTGDGQVNFTVIVADGYTFAGLTTSDVTGTYKNLKDVSTEELPYTYRITKVTSDLAIKVSATKTDAGSDDSGDAAGSDDTGGTDDSAESFVMYRLYNPNSGEHFYTADAAERDTVVAAGWNYEGEAWTAPATSGTPVYRLYNSHEKLGDHHYTTDKDEYDSLVAAGWTGEGIGWYSDDAEGEGLYRLYNPNAYPSGLSGAHHYTTSSEEKDHLVAAGWVYEGYGWYGVAA